ncbi:MAG: hypothetical protein HeimC2_01010 [Candidatus Heimdallarchaeota archaeon LC_2]|nr:MAG: hypothetical protein HeimC2_01010 [Candidatus Heimdallarchaeota archaeon LC_2]
MLMGIIEVGIQNSVVSFILLSIILDVIMLTKIRNSQIGFTLKGVSFGSEKYEMSKVIRSDTVILPILLWILISVNGVLFAHEFQEKNIKTEDIMDYGSWDSIELNVHFDESLYLLPNPVVRDFPV